MHTLFCFLLSVLPVAAGQTPQPHALMPRAEDFGHVWWAEGFPERVPDAFWWRVIQTGHYAMVLDTQTLQVPHFGPLPAGKGDHCAWRDLPPAELGLSISASGKVYRCRAGGTWSQFAGPRLIESGRFLQRADVTDLDFRADDSTRLNVEARFESVAWPDRLGLILAARPGLKPIAVGEASFGRVGGGFGLDGTNHIEVPYCAELDAEQFTVELWAFVPTDYRPSQRTWPWLLCRGWHEHAAGHFGLMIQGGRPRASLNIGGGRDNLFVVDGKPIGKTEAWHHLAMSYDGGTLRLVVDGQPAGQREVGLARTPSRQGLALGRRLDNHGDGYHFRGVLDEVRFYDRALSLAEIRNRYHKPDSTSPTLEPALERSFSAAGRASLVRPTERWSDGAMTISLTAPNGTRHRRWELPAGQVWTHRDWQEVPLALDPTSLELADLPSPSRVQATDRPSGATLPVTYEPVRSWHRINLDGVQPVAPPGPPERQNDAMERTRLVLSNPTGNEQIARLFFEKTGPGIRQRFGQAITGISAILRDAHGEPTGIPVQLSKNWHGRPEGGVGAGVWFHGFTQVRLPARADVELELTLVYGHWGGVPAASHAQLCLIGWGSNQLWEQSALGSWGESICYEPDQVQAECGILDVRPVMVRSMAGNQRWNWTHNVGGGDFFRCFDRNGRRMPPSRMRSTCRRSGPCLTEVTHAGRVGAAIKHSATVSLARTDDIVRGVYHVRMDVSRPVEFSRLVLFQIGADTYSYTGERKMALGNEAGLLREWSTQWGGNVNRTEPQECRGRVPWISLHEAVRRAGRQASGDAQGGPPGAWANRGIVIRSWNAQLGGKPARPWMVEHGVRARGYDTSTADIVPPPGVVRLEAGDFVEATFEHLVVPQFAEDYYGPNEPLRRALAKDGNTWRMIYREAVDNDRKVQVKIGTLESLYPAIRIRALDDVAELMLRGGLGYVPVTVTGLRSPGGYDLWLDGQAVNQAVHGNDFWQTDYDSKASHWSRTYNVPIPVGKTVAIRFSKTP